MMAFTLSQTAVTTIGFVLVIGFCIWKFLIQPRENEGKPIEPPEEDYLESQEDS